MKPFCIIGTAGHIDHGKTTLIRALTNINTDRWKEEQERGMTIDLGFAYMDMPDGRRIGIVDVPGHEKFIKNMVAGAVGMDLILLVVDAKEGIMPQTREHMRILDYLNVNKGIGVISKMDLVSSQRVLETKELLNEFLSHGPLKNAPIIEVDAISHNNIEKLREMIFTLLDKTPQKPEIADFFQPVDRAFSLKGIGTVITGTVMKGSVNSGQRLNLLPQGKVLVVKQIHNHNQIVQSGCRGQRIAINLAGINATDMGRGDVLAAPGKYIAVKYAIAKISISHGAEQAITKKSAVSLHIGTGINEIRILPMGGERIDPGSSSLAQIMADNPIPCFRNQRFVLRQETTIGGGVILELLSRPFKGKFLKQPDFFDGLEQGDWALYIEKKCQLPPHIYNIRELCVSLSADDKELVDHLPNEKFVIIKNKLVCTNEYFQKILGTVISRITDSDGLTREEIARIDKAGYNEFTDFIINNLQENEIALHMGKYMHRSTFENQSKTGSLAEEAAYNIIHGGKFSPPLRVDLEKELQYSENEIRDALNSLVKQERIIRINYNLLISSENIDEIIARVIDWEVGSKEFTVSEFRQRLDISRKYAVPICEYLDREGITERRGDVRVIVAEWEE